VAFTDLRVKSGKFNYKLRSEYLSFSLDFRTCDIKKYHRFSQTADEITTLPNFDIAILARKVK